MSKACVFDTHAADHQQCNASLLWKKKLPVTRRVRIVIKHVHLFTYATVIKHVHERASFCNISKAGLAIVRKVMSTADADIYFRSH